MPFQFPPPRGGEPNEGYNRRTSDFISIPAPARGRTHTYHLFFRVFFISIPAPARGRTQGEFPRRVGADISIPAPARGRTAKRLENCMLTAYFNSRPREGANCKTVQNRAVYLVSLLKFGRISAILPYILSATRAKKRETPKIIGFLLRRPTGRSCTEPVSYTHLTLPTNPGMCRSRWSPYH